MVEIEEIKLIEKIKGVLPFLDERTRRIYLASEAKALGRGGIRKLEKLLNVSHNTINRGLKELEADSVGFSGRVRMEGGGRKKKSTPEMEKQIDFFIEPHTRGEPDSPLCWISKSLRNISDALKQMGFNISHRAVGEILKSKGFSLQGNRKTFEGNGHKDRDAQFEFINKKSKEYLSDKQPVISVDAKKRELVGNYRNNGKEWHKKGSPEEVNAYDFLSDSEGVAIPYGIYDIGENNGWVNVGITKDTAEFAIQSIRNWWYKMGIYYHNTAHSLLITADGGGSNSSKGKLWKYELQKFADETGMEIEVLHFPPGTSKWNKIEHRLFSYISKNWRGKPLTSYKVIVNLIGSTKTKNGLLVNCELDSKEYKTGIFINDENMNKINIIHNKFHPEWNYKIHPK